MKASDYHHDIKNHFHRVNYRLSQAETLINGFMAYIFGAYLLVVILSAFSIARYVHGRGVL
jgi:hypothetical protein